MWLIMILKFNALFLLSFYEVLSLSALKSAAGYISLFVIAAATYLSARHLKIIVVTFAVYAWLTVGVIQSFILFNVNPAS